MDPAKDVVILGMPSPQRLPALRVGAVDAAMLNIGPRYLALDAGLRELLFMGSEVKNSWGTLATTDRLLKKNPQLVARFVRAGLKGLRLFSQNREAAVGIMEKFSGLKRSLAGRIYDDLKGTFSRDGTVDEETQRSDLAVIREITGAKQLIPISKGYDFSIVRKAQRQLNEQG